MKLKFGLRLRVWVHYPNGKKKKIIDRRSRSYVSAFITNVRGSWSNTPQTIKDTGGTNRSYYGNNQLNAGLGDTTYGIVIGNGFSDVIPADYALANKYTSGVGSGQMTYSKQNWTPFNAGISNKRSFELYRYFGNSYSFPQVVRECGIYVKQAGASIYYCFVRDLLGAIEIPPNGGISINYTPEITI